MYNLSFPGSQKAWLSHVGFVQENRFEFGLQYRTNQQFDLSMRHNGNDHVAPKANTQDLPCFFKCCPHATHTHTRHIAA